MTHGREQRHLTLDEVEVRGDATGDTIEVRGHAAVWGRTAWIGPPKYGFSERFEQGSFKESINGGADVRYLFNHNPDAVLARTKSGTLQLGEDPTGLKVNANLAPTTVGRDLAILMERGDINQMSVGMQVLEDRWEEVVGNDGHVYELRTIIKAKLFDVSAVTYPAYEETDAGLREADLARELRDARGVGVRRRTADRGGAEPATATPPDPTPPHGGETPEDDPTSGGVFPSPEPATATPHPDAVGERSLPLHQILMRHAQGGHQETPRLLCPACAQPATATA